MVDFVEICNVCARKAIIEGVKRIINSDKVCRSYSDLNFGVTFFGTQCSTVQVEGITVWSCCPTQPRCLCTPHPNGTDGPFHWTEAQRQMATDPRLTMEDLVFPDLD